MKALVDRLGGALTTIIVAFLIATFGMIFRMNEIISKHETYITLLQYRNEVVEVEIKELKKKLNNHKR